MTTTASQIQDLIAMAEAVDWPVIRGGHNVKIKVPGRGLPVSLPGTPSDHRAMTNVTMLLKRNGLHQAYEAKVLERRPDRRNQLTTVRTRTPRKTAAAVQPERAAEPTQAAQIAKLISDGIADGMTIGFEMIKPEDAIALTTVAAAAMADGGFRQRTATQSVVDNYTELMKHGRWMQFLPDGVIGVDPDGVLINGRKRMLAVAAAGVAVGFVVARNVPREMFPFFDRAQPRTAAHVFEIDGLPSGPDHSSTMKLAMRYEEMLRGLRDPATWGAWAAVRDPNDEALDFYRRNTAIAESVTIGKGVGYSARIVPAAAAVFHYYADKAWPDRPNDSEGYDPLDTFISHLQTGEHKGRNAPTWVLREWSKDTYADKERVPSKREVHLYLLLRHWTMHVEDRTVPGGRVQYQKTWAMPTPYHPDGPDAAVKNIFGLKK